MRKKIRRAKRIIFFLIILFFLVFLLSRGHIYDKDELTYGITFSEKQAKDLRLDWQKVYLAILDDLGVKKIRLAAYWNEIEPTNGNFFWDNLDWEVKEASSKGAEIILAVGGRLPRWPECHFPDWINGMSVLDREEKILSYIKKTVDRYKENKQIAAWQVENEPFLSHFGDCPKLNRKLLDKEIALVRSLDSRPIVVTDSGELSVWIPAARRADIFGTTMYRDTYSSHLKRYIHYPVGPGFFRLKKNIASFFAHPKKWIVVELQAEPWTPVPYQNVSQAERDRTMNLEKFKEMIEFARLTGFKEFYLWGAEWWYWEREANNKPEMWEEAKSLFNKD